MSDPPYQTHTQFVCPHKEGDFPSFTRPEGVPPHATPTPQVVIFGGGDNSPWLVVTWMWRDMPRGRVPI